MRTFGIRLNSELEEKIEALAEEMYLNISDTLRMVIIQGLKSIAFENNASHSEALEEQVDLLKANYSLVKKNIKSSVLSLTLSERILGCIDEEKIALAKRDAQRILEKNGLLNGES